MIPKNTYRAVRDKAIVWFSQKDIDDVKTRPSGIVIVSGGDINDTELYYEGQKCYIVDIQDDFIKNGDCVYVEYDVMTAGRGVQDPAYSQVIEHVFDEDGNSLGKFVWCEKRNVMCKFENNELFPVPNLIFIKKHIPKEWKFKKVWSKGEEQWHGNITAAHPETLKKGALMIGQSIRYEEQMDSKEYIEKKWQWMVKLDYVLAVIENNTHAQTVD